MNHLAEYITCLEEDSTLLEGLRAKPVKTLNEARLSKEEKDAMWSGNVDQVQAMVGDQRVPDSVREVIRGLPAHLRSRTPMF